MFLKTAISGFIILIESIDVSIFNLTFLRKVFLAIFISAFSNSKL